jgi:TetR/AcrR family transcriptional regulator, transcriptional repressor for nem operon
MDRTTSAAETRRKLLDAAMQAMRLKGYAATTVDDVCRAAGLTKGSFFHHFTSKEELGVAAAEHFASMAEGFFERAPYRKHSDPVDRLLGYVDFRIELLSRPVCECSCLLGTLVQELYDSHPAIREECEKHLNRHLADLAADVAAAKRSHCPVADWSAEGLAAHMQAVLQGSIVLTKARQCPDAAIESLRHLRRYLETLFDRCGEPLPAGRPGLFGPPPD